MSEINNIIFDSDRDNLLKLFEVETTNFDLSVTRDSDGSLTLWSGGTPYKNHKTGNWEHKGFMTGDGYVSCYFLTIDDENNVFESVSWYDDCPTDLDIKSVDNEGFNIFITRDLLNSINIWPSYNKPYHCDKWETWVGKRYDKLTYGGKSSSFSEIKWEDEEPSEYVCVIKK